MNEQEAFALGRNCGLNGADTTNCHYSIFEKPEFTKAWENGKASVHQSEEKGKWKDIIFMKMDIGVEEWLKGVLDNLDIGVI